MRNLTVSVWTRRFLLFGLIGLMLMSVHSTVISQTQTPNVVQGFDGNIVAEGVTGVTIAGGGDFSGPNQALENFVAIGGGANNQASGRNATVAGGFGNQAQGLRATVAGGFNNLAIGDFTNVAGGRGNEASGFIASIGGGANHSISGQFAHIGGGRNNEVNGMESVVGGGAENIINGDNSTIAGGANNNISSENAFVGGGGNHIASGQFATIGGGDGHIVSALHATVGGGEDNGALAEGSTVSGGANNAAGALFSTISGGSGNQAGGRSAVIAGGLSNQASGQSAVVGGGQSNVASGAFSTIIGGTDNVAGADFSIALGQRANVDQTHIGTLLFSDAQGADFRSENSNEFAVRASGGIRFVSGINDQGNPASGVQLFSGGNGWSMLSDRNAKANFTLVDGQSILEKLSQVSITQWNLKSQSESTLHIGPMAQDFYAVFGLGESDRFIHSGDIDGVALSSIQALYQLSQDQAKQIDQLQQDLNLSQQKNERLRSQLDNILSRLDVLEKQTETN